MNFNDKKGLVKIAILFLVYGLFLGLAGNMLPDVAAAVISIEVKGDGVTMPNTFTQAQLEAMEQVQVRYSAINNWPTKKMYVARGVRLADLLAETGLKDEAKVIKVKATDGYSMTFTRKELLQDMRYYYPGLQESHEYYGYIPGSTEGAVEVETILALANAEGNNFDYLSSIDAPTLMTGQRYVTEQSNSAFVKYVCTIEVTTIAPAKWENPAVTPAAGTVAAGTKVTLSTSNMDGDNIHYTTDGSDPTFESPMYNWIKKRFWNTRANVLETINHPIDVKQNMTIKAIAIGFGKADSDIVSFNYDMFLAAAPALTAGNSNNTVGQPVNLTFTDDAAWRGAIASIKVNDNVLSSDQYTVSEGNINIDASVFASAGDYVITVQATGYTGATVTQHLFLPGDMNGDNTVNLQDLLWMTRYLGEAMTGDSWRADFNKDEVINILDLLGVDKLF